MIYLDYASATPVDPEVLKAMQPWFSEKYGNPSSTHKLGQEARAAVDKARMTVADFLSCKVDEVYFTASGTESCNWALLGVVEKRMLTGKQAHLIISQIEHYSVLRVAEFLEKAYGTKVTYLPVDKSGLVSPLDVEEAINPNTVLVSVMTSNNEIGSVQPIEEIAGICDAKDVYFHTDACQASDFMDLDVNKPGVDLLSINAGKIYGPKGVGVLYIKEGVRISPWTFGGAQEFGMRAGTENVPAIVGMSRAIELVRDNIGKAARVGGLKAKLWKLIETNIKKVSLNGELEGSSPFVLNLTIKGISGDTLVKRMDMEGFAISTASACAASFETVSHVLLNLGLTEEAALSSIRVSLGRGTTMEELNAFAEVLERVVCDLRHEYEK